MTEPRVSFIVPVRNDAAKLEVCLRSILGNIGRSRQSEILVIDNGSTDGSGEVAERLGAIVAGVPGKVRVSELRNQAARRATGDVLAFVDADNEISSGWVKAAIEDLRLPAVGAVGALYLAPIDGTWVQRAYGFLRGRAKGRQDTDWLGSGNLAVWRNAFEAVGGFDTTLETCEDVDFCQKLRGSNLRLLSDARLRNVHHGDPQTLRDLFDSERWRGRDNLRVSFRRPMAWASLPSAIIPVLDAIMIGAAGLGLLTMLAAPWPGLLLACTALLVFAAGALLKVLRAAVRDRAVRGLAVLQVFVVACVYDIGRAFALVTPATHRGVNRRETAPAS